MAFVGGEHDHFEEVASAVRPKDEPAIRVLAGVLDRERVVDGMIDVLVSDAVATG